MNKKKFEKIIEKNKKKIILVIVILLITIGSLIVYINVGGKSSFESIDPRANLYSEEEFRYFQDALNNNTQKDDRNYYHYYDYNDYAYCDYSDYGCSHDNYECYFNRKEKCDKRENELEKDAKIIYILNEKDDDRYLIEEYKYGYTYRSTNEYIKIHGNKIILEYKIEINDINNDNYYKENKNKIGEEILKLYQDNDGNYYYYEYNSFRGENVKKSCYKEAPNNKLFYNKCPVF